MCGLNRVRGMPQRPGVVGAWGEDGRVQVSKSQVSKVLHPFDV